MATEPIETFRKAMRTAESGNPEGNYRVVRGVIRDGARLVGAYGIPSDEWVQLAEDAGYAGARWQDDKAQDVVARETFKRLHAKYGDWRLVAAAWKAGEAAADKLAEYPELWNHPNLKPLLAYVTQVMESGNEELRADVSPAEAGAPSPAGFKTGVGDLLPMPGVAAQPMEARADESLRRRLTVMRDLTRQRALSQAEAVPGQEEASTAPTGEA